MPSTWEWIGGGVVLYLLLLARSAWKQGEFKQFLWGLGIVMGLIGLIGGVIWTWIKLAGG
ncbi:hypothetical protein CHU95_01385 [Niveispirillum lacus]|uniref:DUF2788 domain-containing protein n=1 Tax=Niveispirillum lacus TaxID=1981099 RepID=A0A255Z7N6_9PROT|nr:hypothetical protein [Niveispirillum lacus]OYQ37432.1 hypothetical protein CHU95_01385 [Niveispirillum lacus]